MNLFKQKIKLNTNNKLLIIISVIYFIVSILLFTNLRYVIFKEQKEDYGLRSYNAAKMTSEFIDVSKLVKYRDTLKMDEEYEEPVKLLDKIKADLNLKYLYVESWDKNGQRFVVYAASQLGDSVFDSAYGRELLGHKYGYEDYANQVISNHDNIDKYEEVNTSYGHTMCAYYPLKDESGKNVGFVGADIEVSIVANKVNHNILIISLILNTFIILFTVLSIFVINIYFSKPLKKIVKIINNFVNKKHDQINIEPIKLKNIKNSDDIGILANSFNKMMFNVKKYAKHIEQITIEKEQVAAELNIATQIQKSLIPSIFPAFPELEEMDIYAIMQPAQEVGGDFYDFFLLDSDHLAFIIADVSGKGVPAALFMVIAKTLIKNEFNSNKNLEKILENVNQQICQDNSSGMFITAFLGVLNLKTGEVEYSNAGHTKPIGKIQNKQFEEIEVKKQFVLAGMPNLKFKTDKIQMKKGDILFLYTDGISEAKNKDEMYWGKENIISTLNSLDTNKCDLQFISKTLCNKLYDFIGEAPQSDDITMLIIKYNGNNNNKSN